MQSPPNLGASAYQTHLRSPFDGALLFFINTSSPPSRHLTIFLITHHSTPINSPLHSVIVFNLFIIIVSVIHIGS